ncbi:MAG: bifunctional DNA-formamidopyrimidine glycosylase/DNA-(apurinic or apyrimidinic site) lyase [Patescibacteria group bacterium]|jgi:formamidopyrimidine-DNA glycosylase
MPELPEVETIRQDLRKKIMNKKIVQLKVVREKSVLSMVTNFVHAIKGNEIKEIDRRGKLMIFRLKKSFKPKNHKESFTSILVHLKMTGQLIYEKKVHNKVEVIAGGHSLTEKDFDLPNKHTQIIFTFSDKGILFFNDLRRFGYMKLATDGEVETALLRFGIEPLTKNYTFDAFVKALGKRRVSIKVALMDQPRIAGIGNIYADEACFAAGIKPTRHVNALKKDEVKKLFDCISKIIKKAIEHRGTTFKDYMDTEGKKGNYTDFLKVYGHGGDKCPRCGKVIQKIKSNGRGTHFCAGCQH